MSDYLQFENNDTAQSGIVHAAGMQPLSWLSGGRMTADIRPPSLISQGFKLLDRRLVSADGQRLVRLTYGDRSEEHTSETPVTNAQLVCRLLPEKKKHST